MWKGDVVLRNLKLKPGALDHFRLPIKVKAGLVGSLTLKVPWTKLGKEPVVVTIDRVFCLACRVRPEEAYDEDDDAKAAREHAQEETDEEERSKKRQRLDDAERAWLSLRDAAIAAAKVNRRRREAHVEHMRLVDPARVESTLVFRLSCKYSAFKAIGLNCGSTCTPLHRGRVVRAGEQGRERQRRRWVVVVVIIIIIVIISRAERERERRVVQGATRTVLCGRGGVRAVVKVEHIQLHPPPVESTLGVFQLLEKYSAFHKAIGFQM